MNDALKMQISAFVDGELPENESELLLRRLSQDAELRERVAHYLAIGRLIRQDQEAANMAGLRGRILSALGEEPAETGAAGDVADSKLIRPAVGFAIAASVALLAIIGLRQIYLPNEVGLETQLVDEGEPVLITEPTVDDVLREMRRRHARSASDLGSSDMLSQFVSFELRKQGLVEVEPEAGDAQSGDDTDDDAEDTATELPLEPAQ